ncbi:hypothetical protein IAT38_007365 [Cryptococcus sp. DSM 104549]
MSSTTATPWDKGMTDGGPSEASIITSRTASEAEAGGLATPGGAFEEAPVFQLTVRRLNPVLFGIVIFWLLTYLGSRSNGENHTQRDLKELKDLVRGLSAEVGLLRQALQEYQGAGNA